MTHNTSDSNSVTFPDYRDLLRGGEKSLKARLASGGDINMRDEYGNTLLHYAAGNTEKEYDPFRFLAQQPVIHREEIIQVLLQNGADPNVQNRAGQTPIYRAFGCSNIALLLDKGASLAVKDNDGDTPLHAAVWGRHIEDVGILLERGADVNAQNNRGQTALHVIVNTSFFDYDGPDSDFVTSSRTAEAKADLNMAQKLISAGADVNVKDNQGRTVLMIAAERGHTDLVKLLLENKALADHTSFILATKRGHDELARMLQQKGVDVQETDYNIALILAAKEGKVDVVRALLEQGADIHAKDENGNTALMAAALGDQKFERFHGIRKSTETMKLLLEKGADVNAQNKMGDTALIYAVQNACSKKIFTYLSLIEHLSLIGEKEDADALKDLAVDKDFAIEEDFAVDKDGKINLLLTAGADINAKNNAGETALSIAQQNERNVIVSFLKSAGAKE